VRLPRNIFPPIGVTLLAGELMRPLKSRSGIYFSSEDGFTSCQLCTQKGCPGRRAASNPALVKQYSGEVAPKPLKSVDDVLK
jgi:hypothetical protein